MTKIIIKKHLKTNNKIMSGAEKPKDLSSEYAKKTKEAENRVSFHDGARIKEESAALFDKLNQDPFPNQPEVSDPEAERINASQKALEGVKVAVEGGNFDAIVRGIEELSASGRIDDIKNILNALGTLASQEEDADKYRVMLNTLKEIRLHATGKEYFKDASDAYAKALNVK